MANHSKVRTEAEAKFRKSLKASVNRGSRPLWECVTARDRMRGPRGRGKGRLVHERKDGRAVERLTPCRSLRERLSCLGLDRHHVGDRLGRSRRIV
jgi:hypothetical protein